MGSKAPKDLFRSFASKDMTKLTLSQYYTAGRHLLKHRNSDSKAGASAFRLTAGFLYRELPVRISQTISGLKQNPSPYRIQEVSQFKTLMADYVDDFSLLVDQTPEPKTPGTNEQFVDTLRKLKRKYRFNMWTLAEGLRSLSTAVNARDPAIVPGFLLPAASTQKSEQQHYFSSTLAYPNLSAPMAYLAPSGEMEMTDPAKWSAPSTGFTPMQADPLSVSQLITPQKWSPNRVCAEFCDEPSCRNPRLWITDGTRRCAENQTRRFFDWLYSMNLGTQLLIEDHVAIHDFGHNLVQIIQPLQIANKAAHDARAVCEQHYGFSAPLVKIIAPTPTVTTTYVPHYLYSMLFQLLKNALRATVENHKAKHSPPHLPVVKLVMSSGEEDVAFKVSDEGGGIPLSRVDAIWSYLGTTGDRNSGDANDAVAAATMDPVPSDSAKRKAVKDSALSSITFMNRTADMPLFGVCEGLPMTRQIARYFGGDLDLVSMEGVGTDAYLYLSRSRNAVEHANDLRTMLEPNVLDHGESTAKGAAT
ncbi:[Pyruvate dehydrogenase (acetyl-transferring)] kinase isozyme 2 [Coemansia sp. RSA 1813]|nr:[Pyruvate dehydrogenase (acetyl-transferring)] kinase isozyme 2 [Coemansia sp. RSA 1646]KAJ2086496.1 [Pyruvate dehydrogenase (acetyl-transferring)] kinase isozyme 2 [Coemansia sp. RSA 986]KAJ2213504.1 [Pyruvate dehydrogenase (acetyl-transferring)] kinase isozyme 2 [Coemansia sp. RSA 487]KAJ2564844.1 [Pyruvate dehydrogenase (acetyl-transferring)] kinase isozyme 2 [Coemansia sp. RSA 1813]